MDNLLVVTISIGLVFVFLIFFFLINARSSNDSKLEDNLFTIHYPLKKEVADLNQDLMECKIQQVLYLRFGKVNSIKLNSVDWRRIYFSPKSEGLERLLTLLNQRKKHFERPIDH